MIEQPKFTYSLSGVALQKQTKKLIEDQGRKQVDVIMSNDDCR